MGKTEATSAVVGKRAFGDGIPKQWLTDVQKIKEKHKGDPESPEGLIKERVEQIGDKVKDRTLEKPFFFLRDLKEIMTYVDGLKNPTKHGLSQELSNLYNEIQPKMREKPQLLAKIQNEILTSAGKLGDAKLLSMISDLITESYKRVRASLAEYIRKMARIISRS